MVDFLIEFGEPRRPRLGESLENRSGTQGLRVREYTFPWGRAAVQTVPESGYEPYWIGEQLYFCVGRPRFVGMTHEEGSMGFNQVIAHRWARTEPRGFADALTGMFVVARCDAVGLSVVTDQMGFRPVYVGTSPRHEVRAVGTEVETVATVSDRTMDFDLASIGDLLANGCIAFPYTTHRGVTELEPASLTTFRYYHGRTDVRTDTFWLPQQPGLAKPDRVLRRELEDALRFAADDVTLGRSRVAVTLSGGMDSRLVLALVPRCRCTGAITFCSRENRETSIAGRVAAAHGVPQYLAWREPEFYAKLVRRATALIGSELRAAAHGFSVVDNALDRRFDLIVGGYLGDTLIKDHFMPREVREHLRRESVRERLVPWLPRSRRTPVSPGRRQVFTTGDVPLSERIQEEVRARRETRLRAVQRVRCDSAQEWSWFWPASRQNDMAYALCNSRLFPSDELFMHRAIVSFACAIPARLRVSGALARRVFVDVFGKLGRIENANTGCSARASPRAERRARRRRVRQQHQDRAAPQPEVAWHRVEDSWIDYRLLQTLSPQWQSYREELLESPALEILNQVTRGDSRDLIREYRPDLGDVFNRLVIQIGLHLHRLILQR